MVRAFDRIPLLSRSRGHVDEFKHERLALLLRVAHECGPMGRVRLRGRDVVFVSAPELAHEVLLGSARAFDKSPGTRLALYPLAGEGLFTARGEPWRRQRRVIAPLLNHAEVDGFAACMVEASRRVAARFGEGETIELARTTTRIAMAIVGRALFDAETLDDADELGEALTVALAWANSIVGTWPTFFQLRVRGLLGAVRDRGPIGPLRALADRALGALEMPALYYLRGQRPIRNAVATIDRHVARMIAERRASGSDRDDLLARLLRARDDEGSGRMSERQVRDEAVTLFVAGHETTALGLAWAFYELAKQPALYAAVAQEGDHLIGSSSAGDALLEQPLEISPTPRQDVDSLPARDGLLQPSRTLRRAPRSSLARGGFPSLPRSLAVFKEALRMYPPAYVVLREAREDTIVGGHRLPRGTIVAVSIYGIHHHPDVYPDPERFDPDRFTPEAEASRPRSAWLPFGAGPRVCIGNHFALLEGQLVLATLARAVRFEVPGLLRPAPSATLRPEGAMPAIVRRRDPRQTHALA